MYSFLGSTANALHDRQFNFCDRSKIILSAQGLVVAHNDENHLQTTLHAIGHDDTDRAFSWSLVVERAPLRPFVLIDLLVFTEVARRRVNLNYTVWCTPHDHRATSLLEDIHRIAVLLGVCFTAQVARL